MKSALNGTLINVGEPGFEREISAVSSQLSVEGGEKKQSIDKPAIVPLPDDLTVMQLDCGTFHTGEKDTTSLPQLV